MIDPVKNENISVHINKAQKAGARIGKAVGAGASAAYIAANFNDIFVQRGIEATKQLANKKAGLLISAGVSAAFVTLSVLLGKVAGGTIGKIIDKKHEKKLCKEIAAQMNLAQQLQEAENISRSESENTTGEAENIPDTVEIVPEEEITEE